VNPPFDKKRRDEQRTRNDRRVREKNRAFPRRERVDESGFFLREHVRKNGRGQRIIFPAKKCAHDVRAGIVFHRFGKTVEKREQPGHSHGNELFAAHDENAGAHRARAANGGAQHAVVKHLAGKIVRAGFADVERSGERVNEIDGNGTRVAFVLERGFETRELEFHASAHADDESDGRADDGGDDCGSADHECSFSMDCWS